MFRLNVTKKLGEVMLSVSATIFFIYLMKLRNIPQSNSSFVQMQKKEKKNNVRHCLYERKSSLLRHVVGKKQVQIEIRTMLTLCNDFN